MIFSMVYFLKKHVKKLSCKHFMFVIFQKICFNKNTDIANTILVLYTKSWELKISITLLIGCQNS